MVRLTVHFAIRVLDKTQMTESKGVHQVIILALTAHSWISTTKDKTC